MFPSQRFTGNTDQYTRVTNMFNEEIRARYIRITPAGYQGERPGLRIELLGCNGKVRKTTIVFIYQFF